MMFRARDQSLGLATLALACVACHASRTGPASARPSPVPPTELTDAPTALTPAPQIFNMKNGALCDDSVQCLYQDQQQRVWVGTATGLATFDIGTWSRSIIKSHDQLLGLFSKDRGPTSFDEDRNGRLLMAGRFGIRVLIDSAWQDLKPPCPERPDLLLCDRRGDIWAAVRSTDKLWRLSHDKWQLALERIAVPLEISLISMKGDIPSGGTGLHELVEAANGDIWIGAHVGSGTNWSLNPASMPRTRDSAQWTRNKTRYAYEYYNKGQLGVLGAAPIAPLYIFDGTQWRAPETDLKRIEVQLRHDGTVSLMTEQGPCDPQTLKPFVYDVPAESLEPLLCRVPAKGGGEWLVNARRVLRSRAGSIHEVVQTEQLQAALLLLRTSGYICGLDDGNGNLWLGTKDAGLLAVSY